MMCVHIINHTRVHLYEVHVCAHTIIRVHIYMTGRPEVKVNLRCCFLEPSLQILRQDLSLELEVHRRG